MSKPQKDKQLPKKKKLFFKEGDPVYLTAFLKQNKQRFYLCKGLIEKCPGEKEHQIFKVRIVAIGNKAIGGPESFDQTALLGRSIAKKFKELHKDIPFFMQPSSWIEVKPSK